MANGWFWKCPTGKLKPAFNEIPGRSLYLRQRKADKKKRRRKKW